jgi:hypothetical protein
MTLLKKRKKEKPFFFFLDSRKPHSRKAHLVGLGEGVKPWLSHALTRGVRPDSNSRPAV